MTRTNRECITFVFVLQTLFVGFESLLYESVSRFHTRGMWSYSVMVITQDSESCDPGSSPGRTLFLPVFRPKMDRSGWCIRVENRSMDHAWMPERSKGADLRSAGRQSAWVRTPLQAYHCPSGQMDKASVSGAEDCGFESHLG